MVQIRYYFVDLDQLSRCIFWQSLRIIIVFQVDTAQGTQGEKKPVTTGGRLCVYGLLAYLACAGAAGAWGATGA